MDHFKAAIARSHCEVVEIVKILREIEFSDGGHLEFMLPQSFDFALQRLEGMATFLKFLATTPPDQKHALSVDEIILPLEISRKNLLANSVTENNRREIEIF